MSGRGGRGGRGRGRGAVPPSVAASSAYNYNNNSTSSLSSTGAPGLLGQRTEPTQKFPDILLPEVPQVDSFSASAKLAIEYADRLEIMMRSSPSFRPLKNDQSKIDRYSDKYSTSTTLLAENRQKLSNLETDLSFFPDELHSVYVPGLASGALAKASKAKKPVVSLNETLSHLDEIAMKEEEQDGSAAKEEDKNGDEEDEENDDEAVYEDEEFEDETDYNFSYFDNGEDYGDYDDGNDEAVF